MNQQEYQDRIVEQAQLSKKVHGHYGYVAGWTASQCVQMYDLLTSEQQQEFADKLLYSIDQLYAEEAGEETADSPQTH